MYFCGFLLLLLVGLVVVLGGGLCGVFCCLLLFCLVGFCLLV